MTMVPHIIAFAAGVWWLQQQPALPDPAWTLVVAPFAVAAMLLRRPGRALHALGRLALLVLCLAAGFFWAAAFAHWRMADALPSEWEGRDITVVGVVAGLPQAYDRSVRFAFNVERILTPGAQVPDLILLSWWGEPRRDARQQELPRVAPGERWQLVVRLKQPHGHSNPNGFDYEAWLLERGVRATGYVRPRSEPLRLQEFVHAPAYWIESARDRLRTRVRTVLGEASAAGVIAALTMGDQAAIPPEQWQVFTRTGVNHLMSISGLHVTMLSGLAFALCAFLWKRSARLTLLLPATKAAALIGLLAALAYALLAGFAVPAQRTVFMLAVVAIALWRGNLAVADEVLARALLVVLLIDPWAVLAPGFWLSFGAVAVIMLVSVHRLRQPGVLLAWARVQWAVTLALMPPLLVMFQQVSLISPLANALAIPLVSLVVVPLALAGLALPVDALLLLAEWLMALCLTALQWFSALPEAVWTQHAPPAWTLPVAMAGVVWMLLPRGFPSRWIGVLALMPMLLLRPEPPAAGAVRMTVLDVGQGLAVVAQARSHALLFDAGPAFGPTADSGTRIIVPFLRAAGIRGLDVLVISHDDHDHTGGVHSVLQAVPVASMLSSLNDFDPLLLLGPEERRCHSGLSWNWDGVMFEILHPPRGTDVAVRKKSNDRSCVLKISAGGGSVLIAADIERRSERLLLDTAAAALRADVLVVPHHGSRTSSTGDFVRAVAPLAVIFPVGYRNRFRHPHPEVVERYTEAGSSSHRTDLDGAITFELGPGRSLVINRHRDRYLRYWHARRNGGAFDGPMEFF